MIWVVAALALLASCENPIPVEIAKPDLCIRWQMGARCEASTLAYWIEPCGESSVCDDAGECSKDDWIVFAQSKLHDEYDGGNVTVRFTFAEDGDRVSMVSYYPSYVTCEF